MAQIEFNQSLIEERDSEIQEISQEVSAVNDIFRELSVLVQSQKESLNSIEDNIENIMYNTESAEIELRKAQKYNVSYMKKIAIGVTTILVGVLVVCIIL